MELINNKIKQLKDRLEFLQSFNNMGGKVWIEQTGGLSRLGQIKKIEYQIEILKELEKDGQDN